MRPGGIAKQKTVDSSAGAASVLMGSRREPLRLTLNVSTRKKASLPASDVIVITGRNLLRPGNAGKYTAPPRSPSYHDPAQSQTDHQVLTHRSCRPPSQPWRALK